MSQTPTDLGPALQPPDRPAILDEGTYSGLREPRSSNRLALDGVWHQISRRYFSEQVTIEAIFAAIVVVAAVVALIVLDGVWWVWVVAALLLLWTALTLVILRRQVRAMGYMLRADDFVFRRGIMWQRIVAVPYGRLQLVDISQGPLDRAFRIAKVKLITAAATTGVEMPGVSQDAAEALRDTLIEVAEQRRTGL